MCMEMYHGDEDFIEEVPHESDPTWHMNWDYPTYAMEDTKINNDPLWAA